MPKLPAPEMSMHAIARFRERIDPSMGDEAIAAWAERAWSLLGAKQGQAHLRTYLKHRIYAGQQRAYLQCRSPNGKVAILALSADMRTFTTVLDAWQWACFVSTTPLPETRERERIIQKLRQQDEAEQRIT